MTSIVGGLTLPVPAGAANSAIVDPAVDALLDFLAFMIKQALDAKLANLTATAASSGNAVPSANRFAFDPTDPRGHHVRLPVPSLFIWWPMTDRSERVQETLVKEARQRDLGLLYVHEDLPALEEMNRRRGLMSIVDAAIFRASDRQRDPAYSYNGGAPGVPLYDAIASDGNFKWQYMGGRPGRFGIDETPSAERVLIRRSGQDFPALFGQLRVWETITQEEQSYPTDTNNDIEMETMVSDGESTETIPWNSIILQGPDGTEP